MFTSHHVNVLTQCGVTQRLQGLEAAQYLDGVGRERQAVGAALIVGERGGAERSGAKLRATQRAHRLKQNASTAL